MNIELSTEKYREFLTAFRAADRANAEAKGETEVTYTEGGNKYCYYFKAPNFALNEYDIGNSRTKLMAYNHPTDMHSSVSADILKAALRNGGKGSTGRKYMNENLSIVVSLIAEAARSKVVEDAMAAVLEGKSASINLNRYKPLFNLYAHTAEYRGYRTDKGEYSRTWQPLEINDYDQYYLKKDYTGDRASVRAALAQL